MLSLVCVYNNERILNDTLLASLKKQTVPCDLILIDNRMSKYRSAAAALNFGASQAKGDYIVFLHQDMFLGYDRWLEDAENHLRAIPDCGIAGVAGVSEKGKYWQERVKYAFMHRTDQAWKDIPVVEKPEKVQTLDECLLIIPKKIFQRLKFDESTFDGWDCYGADYCLAVRSLGYKAYVAPLPCIHSSVRAYIKIWEYAGLQKYKKRLYDKHKRYYRKIYTFMGTISWSYLKIYSMIIFFGPLAEKCAFLSYQNIWKRALLGCESVLDLGCGINSPLQFCSVNFSTGVDISKDTINECIRLNIFNEAMHKDVRDIGKPDRQYDAVIAVGLLENLDKAEALSVVHMMEEWSDKKTIIVATNGKFDGNDNPLSPATDQKSVWNTRDFSSRGYAVRGINGWKRLRDSRGLIKGRPTLLWTIFSMLTQPLVFLFPGQAYRMIAIKLKNR